MSEVKMNKHEDGFILTLLGISTAALIWLFTPFLPALFLSLLISITSYNIYCRLSIKSSKRRAALIMTLSVTVLLILPLSYLMLVGGIEISGMIRTLQDNFQLSEVQRLVDQTIIGLALPDAVRELIDSALKNNLEAIIITSKDFAVSMLKSIVTLSSQFIFFVILSIFSLYYFYIDGASLVDKIKTLSPMNNHLNNILLKQFSGLSVTLVGSVFIISVLQGVIFAIGVSLIGMPPLFFGVAMALAGFIPILGGLLVWLPLVLYLFAIGEGANAFIILFFGAVLAGTLIDNFLRPVIIQKLASKMNHTSALDHTLVTVLSTLAGIIQFGILGLFIGPIIAAMAITMFDIYQIKYRQKPQ